MYVCVYTLEDLISCYYTLIPLRLIDRGKGIRNTFNFCHPSVSAYRKFALWILGKVPCQKKIGGFSCSVNVIKALVCHSCGNNLNVATAAVGYIKF